MHGCIDINSCNYDSEATVSNNSCEYLSSGEVSGPQLVNPLETYSYTYIGGNSFSNYLW